MSYSRENIGGIFPRPIEIPSPTTYVTKVDLARNPERVSYLAHALNQNPGVGDKGLQLKVGTARTRRGNKTSARSRNY